MKELLKQFLLGLFMLSSGAFAMDVNFKTITLFVVFCIVWIIYYVLFSFWFQERR